MALRQGARADEADPDGVYVSPLHYAAAEGGVSLSVVRELLRAGADPLLRNTEGLTVLDVARQTAGASDMLPMLEDAVTKHAGAVAVATAATTVDPFPYESLLPLDWREDRAKEDSFRTLFVADRENDALDNPHVYMVDLMRFPPRVSLQPSPVPLLFHPFARADTARFRSRWEAFSEGLFGRDFPWSNVLCAGGAVLAASMEIPAKDELRDYFREESLFRGGDIDLFIYGLNPEQATEKARSIMEFLSKDEKKPILFVRTEHCITAVLDSRRRHVQIILRCYKSPAEVLMGFDIDSCCVGFDGETLWALPRAVRALTYGINLVDPGRQSKSYCQRLVKYAKRGFAIAVPGLDRSNINPALFGKPITDQTGLARLLLIEALVGQGFPHTMVSGCTCRRDPPRDIPADGGHGGDLTARLCSLHQPLLSYSKNYVSKSLLIDIVNENTLAEAEAEHQRATDYTSVFLPMGSHWTPKRIENMLTTREIVLKNRGVKVPFVRSLSDIDEVLNEDELAMHWLTENPGTQLTGSFHPTPSEDFWRGVFLRPVQGRTAFVDPIQYNYVAPGDDVITCFACKNIFSEPCRLSCCSEYICKSCVPLATTKCPRCARQPFEVLEPDQVVLKLLAKVPVRCQYRDNGCSWTGSRGALVEHLDKQCQLVIVLCPLAPGCQHKGPRRAIDSHLGTSCTVRRQQQRQRELASLAEVCKSVNPASALELNVGGTLFSTTRETLCKHSGSLLHALFSSKELRYQADGSVFLDRPPKVFEWLLTWLQTGLVPKRLTEEQCDLLAAEVAFWKLDEAFHSTALLVTTTLPASPQPLDISQTVISTHTVACNNPTEDTFIVTQVTGGGVLCGIFDGHCGNFVSDYLRSNVERLVSNFLLQGVAPGAALKKALAAADAEILDLVVSIPDKKERFNLASQGSCAALVLSIGGTVYCAHVGDCEVHASNGTALTLRRHTAEEPYEQHIMLSEWGLVKETDLFALHEDHGKVHIYIKNMLQPTRVVGDHYLRNAELLALHNELSDTKIVVGQTPFKAYVRCQPDVSSISSTSGSNAFVIVGSDGLWDHISADFACEIISKTHPREDAARAVVEVALNKAAVAAKKTLPQMMTDRLRDDYDDTTCLVIFLAQEK